MKIQFYSLLFTEVEVLGTSRDASVEESGKCMEGYRVWEGPSATPGNFCISRVQNKQSGAYFWWIFEVLSKCVSKI